MGKWKKIITSLPIFTYECSLFHFGRYILSRLFHTKRQKGYEWSAQAIRPWEQRRYLANAFKPLINNRKEKERGTLSLSFILCILGTHTAQFRRKSDTKSRVKREGRRGGGGGCHVSNDRRGSLGRERGEGGGEGGEGGKGKLD